MLEPIPQPNQPIVPRIPPHDMEAEQAVLASMLFDREAISSAYEILQGPDFYRPDNQAIYEAMIELFTRGEPVDVVTLGDKLTEKGLIEQIGRDRVIQLAAAYYTSANIRHHAQIVAEKSLLRQLIKASTAITNAGYDAREEVDAIMEMAEKSIFNVSQRRNTTDFAHISDVMVTAMEQLEELFKNKGQATGVETGFTDFDKITAGLQPSDLIILGARPSMGKSAFLINITQHAAIRKKVPTALFTLEMSKEQVGNRMLSAESGVDSQLMRTGSLDKPEYWDRISECMPALSNAPIYIDDTPGITFTELRAKCRRLKIEKNLGLVIVDYLQLMTAPASSRPESRQLEISEISRSLKGLAKELHVPMLVAAQLSRAVEARKDHRPMLSDLRESGAIEQDAEVVAFLYKDEYYNPDTLKKGLAEVIIAKQRNGSTGTVELAWIGHLIKFANLHKY